MGSGTTAIEASALGCRVFGLEVDPYARLISDVSVHAFSLDELQRLDKMHRAICEQFHECSPNPEYVPSLHNIEYWFEQENFTHLLKLKTLINSLSPGGIVRKFFLILLADVVRAASKAERQSLKPYISRRFRKKRAQVLEEFKKAYLKYRNAIANSKRVLKGGDITWGEGDATEFAIPSKVEVAITSPPYINAMDYVRCIKLESAWTGTGTDDSLDNLRSNQIGEARRAKSICVSGRVTEIAGPHMTYLEATDFQRWRTSLAYFHDILMNLLQVNRCLAPGGTYHMIVGDSVIRGTKVPTHRITAELAESVGFTWAHYFRYPIKDHRTSIPRKGRGGKIAEEHVISLRA